MQLIQEGVKVVFGGDASGLLSAANLGKAGVAGMVTASVVALKRFDAAARETEKQWEKSMAEISTLADYTTRDIKGMRGQLAEMSVEYGQAFTDMARARYDVISAGFNTISDSTAILEASARGAVGGLTDISVAAKVTTALLNSYEMQADDAARVNDYLFATVQQGVTTYGELASELGNVASTAKAANVRMTDMLALVATITKGGISTNEAVTAANQFFLAFIKPGPEARKIIQDFDLDLNDMAGTLEKIAEMGESDLEMVAKLSPSVRGLKAALAGAADEGHRFADIQDQIADSYGASTEAYEKMADTRDQLEKESEASKERLLAAIGGINPLTGDAWVESQADGMNTLAVGFENAAKKGGTLVDILFALGQHDLRALGYWFSPEVTPQASPFTVPGSGVIDPSKAGVPVRVPGSGGNALRPPSATVGRGPLDTSRSVAWDTYSRMQGTVSPDYLAYLMAEQDRREGNLPNIDDIEWMDYYGSLEGEMANMGGFSMKQPTDDLKAFDEAAMSVFGNLESFADSSIRSVLSDAFGAGESSAAAFAAAAIADITMVILKTLALEAVMRSLGIGERGKSGGGGVEDIDVVDAALFGLNGPGIFGKSGGGYVPGFAWGGYTGGSIDRNAAAGVVHAGEFVLRQEATRAIGAHNLERMNRLGGDTINVGGIHLDGTNIQNGADLAHEAAAALPSAIKTMNRQRRGRAAARIGGSR